VAPSTARFRRLLSRFQRIRGRIASPWVGTVGPPDVSGPMPMPIHSQTLGVEDRRLIRCGDWLVSQELYRERQSQNLSFDQSWSWVWVVQRGSAILELGDTQHQYFLDADDINFVFATDRQQQFTVTRAPLLLTRLRLPLIAVNSSAGFATSGHADFPLLTPLLQLIQQARDSGAASSTCSQLGEALRSYFDSQIRAAGISLPSSELDPIKQLLSGLSQRLSESLGLPDLADMVHLSPRRLQELTQDRLGCSPMELLRRLRLELLHRLLLDPAESGESLQVLLDRCRLPASSATRQAFQLLYGLTPSGLRRQVHSQNTRQSLADPV